MPESDGELETGEKEAQRDAARRDFEEALGDLWSEDGDQGSPDPGDQGKPGDGPLPGPNGRPGAQQLRERGEAYWREQGEQLAPLVMLTWGGGLELTARALGGTLPEGAVDMETAQKIGTAAAPVVEKWMPRLVDKWGLELAFISVLAYESREAVSAIARIAQEKREEEAGPEPVDDEKPPEEPSGSRFDGLKEGGL